MLSKWGFIFSTYRAAITELYLIGLDAIVTCVPLALSLAVDSSEWSRSPPPPLLLLLECSLFKFGQKSINEAPAPPTHTQIYISTNWRRGKLKQAAGRWEAEDDRVNFSGAANREEDHGVNLSKIITHIGLVYSIPGCLIGRSVHGCVSWWTKGISLNNHTTHSRT